MNSIHFHLLVNHFPVICPIIGIILLAYGMYKKNATVQKVAYFVLIFGAIFGPISGFSGDKAAESLKEMNIPSINMEVVHNHEETAEKVTLFSIVLGIAAAIAWNRYNKLQLKKISNLNIVLLVLSAVMIFITARAAYTGGEIRHPEINENYNPTLNTQDPSVIADPDQEAEGMNEDYQQPVEREEIIENKMVDNPEDFDMEDDDRL